VNVQWFSKSNIQTGSIAKQYYKFKTLTGHWSHI